ncbi:MAG: cation:proton antiporter [Rhodococcus sp.]|nr:cation:proton antiporter [Rhodococcus sp. (in: high G+C Gram-positive bacteria)]
MIIVYGVAATFLLIAAILVSYRLLRGPNSLDRLVAMDSLIGMLIAGLAVWAAFSGNTTVVTGMVTLSLVSFIASVSVARFRVSDK